MTEKELKKLNRTELLELLLIQTQKNDELEEKLLPFGEERQDLYGGCNAFWTATPNILHHSDVPAWD